MAVLAHRSGTAEPGPQPTDDMLDWLMVAGRYNPVAISSFCLASASLLFLRAALFL